MEFKKGDIIRIRDWDDMAEGYIVDYDGDIRNVQTLFLKSQKILCGREAVVDEVEEVNDGVGLIFTMLDDGAVDFTYDWACQKCCDRFDHSVIFDFFGFERGCQ